MKLLKRLCTANGISGREENIKSIIKKEISGLCDISEDRFGNLIATVHGKKRDKRVCYFAHTDEVGFIISDYDEQGFARFVNVGGIDAAVLPGKVLCSGRRKGVIGVCPVHLLSTSDKETVLKSEDLFIDFGFEDKKQAEKRLPVGSAVYFEPTFYQAGNEIFAKALDDRIGVRIMIDMIKSKPLYDTTFVFTCCEETGTQGAETAAYGLNTDIGVILECTTSAQTPDENGGKAVTLLGGGAVISYRDNGTMYDTELFALATSVAEKNGIKWQTKTLVAGGNDASAVQKTAYGASVAAFSVAARNLHSAISVANKNDYFSVLKLAKAFNDVIGL